MASGQQLDMSEAGRSSHPTRGRGRKFKGPPSNLPQLPLTAIQHRLDTSSDNLEEEKQAEETEVNFYHSN